LYILVDSIENLWTQFNRKLLTIQDLNGLLSLHHRFLDVILLRW